MLAINNNKQLLSRTINDSMMSVSGQTFSCENQALSTEQLKGVDIKPFCR